MDEAVVSLGVSSTFVSSSNPNKRAELYRGGGVVIEGELCSHKTCILIRNCPMFGFIFLSVFLVLLVLS